MNFHVYSIVPISMILTIRAKPVSEQIDAIEGCVEEKRPYRLLNRKKAIPTDYRGGLLLNQCIEEVPFTMHRLHSARREILDTVMKVYNLIDME